MNRRNRAVRHRDRVIAIRQQYAVLYETRVAVRGEVLHHGLPRDARLRFANAIQNNGLGVIVAVRPDAEVHLGRVRVREEQL